MWPYGGFKEIQGPRRRNVLIDYDRLQRLLGANSYDQLRSSHRGWVEEYLANGVKDRQGEWTESIAVGSKFFIENVKGLLGRRAKDREVIGGGERYQLREEPGYYTALFEAKNGDIGLGNSYIWEV
jgi:putative transposase